ncbi:MAG: GNAT family N-acetyltransferase [Saprospiraceae bacterium]
MSLKHGLEDLMDLIDDLEIQSYNHSYTRGYTRTAFDFLRRSAGGAYTSRSLVEVANQADSVEEGIGSDTRISLIRFANRPSSFDEETEIKTGGPVGCLLVWDSGKALLAVKSSARGKGIGSQLVENLQRAYPESYFWVNKTNIKAQRFLLKSGLTPTAMNSQGAIRYSFNENQE